MIWNLMGSLQVHKPKPGMSGQDQSGNAAGWREKEMLTNPG
jgi:hypothetical protein